MKKTVSLLAALALVIPGVSLSTAAMAQGNASQHRSEQSERNSNADNRHRSEQSQRNSNADDRQRSEQSQRNSNAQNQHRFKKGERFDRSRATNYHEVNYRNVRGLSAPPSGYRYVQSGNDVLLIGITSGIVSSVFSDLLR